MSDHLPGHPRSGGAAAAPTPAALLGRRGFLFGSGGALALVLSGCMAGASDGSDSAATDGAAADSLTFALPAYPGSWDQDFVGFDSVALALYKNIYPYMVEYSTTTTDGTQVQDTENIVPLAAFVESFEADDSGKVWTLKLKEGVTFPSGNELTAADVKWSKDRAFAAQSNVAGIYRLIGLTKKSQVEVVDDYTVTFTQDYASALTPQIQAISMYVYDSTEVKKHATDDDPWAKDWVAKNPQGGGYYNVETATDGQEIVLTANPVMTGDWAPKTATITMPVVSSTANLVLQLQNGDVDVAMGLSSQQIADLQDTDGIDIISAASNEMVTIQMSVVTAPFDDVKVRQALAYAIPYEDIISSVYKGDARAVKSPVPLEMPGYSESGYPYTQDADKAKELLAAAGQSDLSTELVYSSGDAAQEAIAVLVQNALKEIGVTLELTPLDAATLASRREDKDIPMQLASGQQWVNDVEYLLSTSLTDGAALNYSNYTNDTIEKIFEKSHTISDSDERIKLWAQVQDELAADVPWLVLCQPNFNLPVRSGIAGWVQPVDELFRLQYLTKSA